ncbi:hypothetical protein [Tropicibacter sp. S64]|uniref:hypothetical protein n=1 Tax=Tropicibacter sp. S64 TaxID=3415122 RepID=UPI003C7B9D03
MTLVLAPCLSIPSFADVVLTTDEAIIQNDLCVGASCAAAEDFNATYSELKVKGGSTRLRFDDVSITTGFPSRDWAIATNGPVANDPEEFRIEDETSGSVPFRIEGGAPDGGLHLASNGRLGIGTSIPGRDVHLIGTGTIAAIRMESGDGAQVYDLLNSVGTFLVYNQTANTQPFIIKETVPDGAIYMRDNILDVNAFKNDYNFRVWGTDNKNNIFADAATGSIGLGLNNPASALHVQRTDGTASVLVENTAASPSAVREMFAMRNNGGSYFTLDNTSSGTTWYFTHENASPNRFIITDGVADGPEMTLSAEGNLTIQGQLFTAGSCTAGCDRVFEADYPLPSIAEQAAMMRERKHLPNVGPTPENGPFNLTQMTGGMLNELEKAHLYIAELEERLRVQEAENAAMTDRLAAVETWIARQSGRD